MNAALAAAAPAVPVPVPVLALLALGFQEPAADAPAPDDRAAAEAAVEAALAEQGIDLDLDAGTVALDGEVLVRDQLLEYLLIGEFGASHESLFRTPVTPSVLNAALLATGLEEGTNARWAEREGGPAGEDVTTADYGRYEVTPPAGDGLYLHVGWVEGGETYWFRAEDLVVNLDTGRPLGRHKLVYLGSRLIPGRDGAGERFAADVEGNLVNLAWFSAGNTLFTTARPECERQDVWVANVLVPPRGAPVRLVFAEQPLVAPPPGIVETLPAVPEALTEEAAGR